MPRLLTHDDLDGAGCEVLWRGTRQGEVEAIANGAIDARVRALLAAGESLVVADHGITEATAQVVDRHLAAGGSFELFDHHRSSRHLAGRSWALVDESRSATGLLFDRVGRPSAFADFSEVVEDHDLWRHQDPRSARLAALLGLLGHDRFVARFASDPRPEPTVEEALVLELEEDRRTGYLERRLSQARVLEAGGHRWAVVYADQYQSDLAELLMNRLGVEATAIVNPAKRTVSLRGRGVDVSRLAERHGGGGHARAAAFSFAGAQLESGLKAFELALADELADA